MLTTYDAVPYHKLLAFKHYKFVEVVVSFGRNTALFTHAGCIAAGVG